MSFETTFGNEKIYLAAGTLQLELGTCQLDQDFGEVENASIGRKADFSDILDCCGGLIAKIVNNPRFELTFTSYFDETLGAPGLLDRIDFPFAGIGGHITDPTINWEQGGVKKLTSTATSWDSLGATPGLYQYDCSDGSSTELLAPGLV